MYVSILQLKRKVSESKVKKILSPEKAKISATQWKASSRSNIHIHIPAQILVVMQMNDMHVFDEIEKLLLMLKNGDELCQIISFQIFR